jgi:hypothetical protein
MVELHSEPQLSLSAERNTCLQGVKVVIMFTFVRGLQHLTTALDLLRQCSRESRVLYRVYLDRSTLLQQIQVVLL